LNAYRRDPIDKLLIGMICRLNYYIANQHTAISHSDDWTLYVNFYAVVSGRLRDRSRRTDRQQSKTRSRTERADKTVEIRQTLE